MSHTSVRQVLEGQRAAPGMALGRVRLLQPRRHVIDDSLLRAEDVNAELERLDLALARARGELADLRQRLHGALAHEAQPFLDTHALILDDPELRAGLDDMIRTGRFRAAAALQAQRDRLVQVFRSMDDPYLRTREDDLQHVIARVLDALEHDGSSEEHRLAARLGEILVAENPSPAEVAGMAELGMRGIIASGGSAYSHAAILARSLHLPMLCSVPGADSSLGDGDLVLLDGERGIAIAHPTAQDLGSLRQWQREQAARGRLPPLPAIPARSRDGVAVALYANAELPGEVAEARALGAMGVGLYRTELLYLRKHTLPDEDEQFAALRELLQALDGAPATLRTLDLGADKAIGTGLDMPAEANPALGVRGVRHALRHPEILRTQLRAMLRAAALGPLRILLPMVTLAEEVAAVRAHALDCLAELKAAGAQVPDVLPALGAMIEVPAAALGVRALLAEADFLAIGTNDLAQYVLATDRNLGALSALYDPRHPALLRLIAGVAIAARRANKPLSVCGEIAGDPVAVPLLLALGIRELSMAPARLAPARAAIEATQCARLRALVPRLLRASSRSELEALLCTLGSD